MPNTKTTVAFHGTAEQEQQLREYIAGCKDTPGSTMIVMQKAQEIYGYLPEEVQIIIAEELGVPLSKVYGISTFYSLFSLNPKGENDISVCLGTACYVKGSQAILDEISKQLNLECGSTSSDGKYSLAATRCLGCCGLAPVMVINGDVYGRLDPSDVKGILAKY